MAKYIANTLQLCKLHNEGSFTLHYIKLVGGCLQYKKQQDGKNPILEYIKNYIEHSDTNNNQTFLRAPIILSFITQLKNKNDIKKILDYCEKTIQKNQSIGNTVLPYIALESIKNVLNFYKGEEALVLSQLSHHYPNCFEQLPCFNLFEYFFDENQSKHMKDDQKKQIINLFTKTNYFTWRYMHNVVYSFGSNNPIVFNFGNTEKIYTKGITINCNEETSFYNDFYTFFSLINGDTNLLQQFVCNTISEQNKELWYWNYMLFVWFKNQGQSANLSPFLNQLQEQNPDIYKTLLYFMLPPISGTFRSHTFCREWPADFFIQECPDHLMNALQFFLSDKDQIESYLATLCSSLSEKSLNDLFNFMYEKNRKLYTYVYSTCCKLALQKNYSIKTLAMIQAPNKIFLNHFNFSAESYLTHRFENWNPVMWDKDTLKNTWELQVLPDAYNGMLDLNQDYFLEFFLETIEKGCIFLQFLLRFSKRENILELLKQDRFKEVYLWYCTHNTEYLINAERLLQEKIGKTSKDFIVNKKIQSRKLIIILGLTTVAAGVMVGIMLSGFLLSLKKQILISFKNS